MNTCPVCGEIMEIDIFQDGAWEFCPNYEDHIRDHTCAACMDTDERLYTVWHEDDDNEERICEGCGRALYLNGETLCSMCAEAGPLA